MAKEQKFVYSSCNIKFQLLLNSFFLERQQAIKYFGIYIDETFKWTKRIHQLSSQLARYAGIFYRIRNLAASETLRMFYHSLIHSRLQYGIPIWRNLPKIFMSLIYGVMIQLV